MAGATYTVTIKDFDKDGDITSESIVKALKAIKNVSDVKFDRKEGVATITIPKKSELTEEAVNKALKDLGLSCDEVEVKSKKASKDDANND